MYYFHVRFRIPKWETSTPEEETPEFSSEDEESEEEESFPVETAVEFHPVDQNPKEALRSRRRNLVYQERIIRPQSDFERSDDAQKYRELKERGLRLKLSRIREGGLLNVEEKKVSSMSRQVKRKLSEKEKEKLRKKAKEKHKWLMNSQRKKMKTERESILPDKLPITHPHDEDEPTADQQGQLPVQVQSEPEAVEEDSLREPVVNGSLLSMDDDLLNLDDDDDDATSDDKDKERERNSDVSANTVRKIKVAFRMKISSVIVQILNPYLTAVSVASPVPKTSSTGSQGQSPSSIQFYFSSRFRFNYLKNELNNKIQYPPPNLGHPPLFP
jgi:hypothetical protein